MPTHEDYLTRICAVCLGKGQRNLTEEQIGIINEKLCRSFKANRNILPSQICNSCRLRLSQKTHDNSLPSDGRLERLLLELKNLPPRTRSNQVCHCSICKMGSARFVMPGNSIGKRGRPPINPTSAPSTNNSSPVTICRKCMQKVGQGLNHVCSKEAKLKNLNDLISPHTKEQLASSHIKCKVEKSGSQEVPLATGGRPLRVSIEAPSNSTKRSLFKEPISHSTMFKLQESLNLSDYKLQKAGQIIRAEMGRKSIESNLSEGVQLKSHELDNFFSARKCFFGIKNEKGDLEQKERTMVYCTNVDEFIRHIEKQRNCTGQMLYKLGMDGGGNSIKICVNLIESKDSDLLSPVKKKTRENPYLDSGVKKLFILAIVPCIPESYQNVKVMLDFLKKSQFDFSIATDLKLCNVLIGIQSHSSRHPCTWCEGTAPWNVPPQLRTLGRIKYLVKSFIEAGCPMRKAQNYFNCINFPLIMGNDEDLILDLVPIPELHLFLGITNRLFDTLNERMGNNEVFKWAHSMNIVRIGYRGGSMEGNMCRLLLQKLDELQNFIPDDLQCFVVALRKFDIVRKSCFGKRLEQNYKQNIQDFSQAFAKLGINIFPKMHALFVHVPQFCDRKGKSLGHFSEQASESVHHDFKLIWERYSVPLDHPQHEQRLLRAICKYNSMHI